MAKQLSFNYDGKDYTLEFTRNSVKTMERNGFVADNIDTMPMTVLPELFAGAFLAHHRFEKRNVIDEIYEGLENKPALIEKLSEMYNDTISTLLSEPDEGKNVKWTANW